MFIQPFCSNYSFCDRLRFAPDDGGGDGGAGNEGGDPDGEPGADEKKYSDKDMEQLVLSRLKKKDKELAAAKKEIETLKSAQQTLQDQIDAIGDGDLTAEDKKKLGRLEAERKSFEQKIETLSQQNATFAQQLEAETVRRQNVERDQLLESALSKVKCLDNDTAKLIFRDKLEWDEDDEKWMFRTKSGNHVDVDLGVSAELPDYMRPADARGGSGTTGSSTRKSAGAKKVESIKSEMALLETQIRNNSPNKDSLLSKHRQLKRELQQLESQK